MQREKAEEVERDARDRDESARSLALVSTALYVLGGLALAGGSLSLAFGGGPAETGSGASAPGASAPGASEPGAAAWRLVPAPGGLALRWGAP